MARTIKRQNNLVEPVPPEAGNLAFRPNPNIPWARDWAVQAGFPMFTTNKKGYFLGGVADMAKAHQGDVGAGLGGIGAGAAQIMNAESGAQTAAGIGSAISGVGGMIPGPVGMGIQALGGVTSTVANIIDMKDQKEKAAREERQRIRNTTNAESRKVLANYESKGTGIMQYGKKGGKFNFPYQQQEFGGSLANLSIAPTISPKSNLFAAGGNLNPISDTAQQVSGNNPNQVDGVDMGDHYLDHDETVVDTPQGQDVYSDDLKILGTNSSFSDANKKLQKQKKMMMANQARKLGLPISKSLKGRTQYPDMNYVDYNKRLDFDAKKLFVMQELQKATPEQIEAVEQQVVTGGEDASGSTVRPQEGFFMGGSLQGDSFGAGLVDETQSTIMRGFQHGGFKNLTGDYIHPSATTNVQQNFPAQTAHPSTVAQARNLLGPEASYLKPPTLHNKFADTIGMSKLGIGKKYATTPFELARRFEANPDVGRPEPTPAELDAAEFLQQDTPGFAGGGKWIQKAIKRPGAFTRKAKAAGMTPAQYQRKVLGKDSKASTRTKQQAALRKTLVSKKMKAALGAQRKYEDLGLEGSEAYSLNPQELAGISRSSGVQEFPVMPGSLSVQNPGNIFGNLYDEQMDSAMYSTPEDAPPPDPSEQPPEYATPSLLEQYGPSMLKMFQTPPAVPSPAMEKMVNLNQVRPDARLADLAAATTTQQLRAERMSANPNVVMGQQRRLFGMSNEARNRIMDSVQQANLAIEAREAGMNTGIGARNIRASNLAGQQEAERKMAIQRNIVDSASEMRNLSLAQKAEKNKRLLDQWKWQVASKAFGDTGVADRSQINALMGVSS